MAVAIVQSTGQVQSTSYITDQALTGVTAGNTLVVVASDYFNSLGTFTASIVAGGSGTFTDAITSSLIGGAGGVQTGILYLTNCPGGSITVEVSGTNEQAYFSFEIFELSGVDNTTPTTDAKASAVGTFPSTTSLPLSLTSSAGGMVFTSVTASYGSSVTFTPPTGYTQDYNDTSYAVANAAVAHIATTGTTQDATWTVASTGSMSVGSVAVAFKTSGGGTSASASQTDGADAQSASAAASFVGASAQTDGADVQSATGASTSAAVGSAAQTDGADLQGASAAVGFTGVASQTDGADAQSAHGSVLLAGQATQNDAADAQSAAGALTFVASSAQVDGADAQTAAGQIWFVGAAFQADGQDVQTAVGTAVNGFVGSAAQMDGADPQGAYGQGWLGALMPSVVGLHYRAAIAALIEADVMHNDGSVPAVDNPPPTLGVLAPWPVSLQWRTGSPEGRVVEQIPAAGQPIFVSDAWDPRDAYTPPITLAVNAPRMGVSGQYTAGGYS